MESQEEGFLKKKKLLMEINSGELNKSILYYINEARTSPKDFSQHLISEDDNDEEISKLSLFFKNYSIKVPPLELNKNLELTSKDLIFSIIGVDDGSSYLNFSEDEKIRNNLHERLKKYNLIPVFPANYFIIGVDNAIEALANIFMNKKYRDKILSPEMKYIGITSDILPSERLCIVIDMVNSFKNYNLFLRKKVINYTNQNNNYKSIRPSKYNYIRFTNYDSDEDEYNNEENSGEEDFSRFKKTTYGKYTYFNPKYNTDKKKMNTIKYFNSVGVAYPHTRIKYNNYNFDENNEKISQKKKNNKKESFDLRISKQTYYSPSTTKYFKSNNYYDMRPPKRFKLPISVSIEKKYNRDQYGDIYPIYNKKTFYDDGSVLIQPYFCEDDEM